MPTPAKSGSKPVKAATTTKPAAATAKKTAAEPKAAVKSAAKPAAAKPAAPKKAPAAKKATAPAAVGGATMADLSEDQRRYYIEVAAYYIAERRGFHGGSELDDWVQAEAEVSGLVQKGVLKP